MFNFIILIFIVVGFIMLIRHRKEKREEQQQRRIAEKARLERKKEEAEKEQRRIVERKAAAAEEEELERLVTEKIYHYIYIDLIKCPNPICSRQTNVSRVGICPDCKCDVYEKLKETLQKEAEEQIRLERIKAIIKAIEQKKEEEEKEKQRKIVEEEVQRRIAEEEKRKQEEEERRRIEEKKRIALEIATTKKTYHSCHICKEQYVILFQGSKRIFENVMRCEGNDNVYCKKCGHPISNDIQRCEKDATFYLDKYGNSYLYTNEKFCFYFGKKESCPYCEYKKWEEGEWKLKKEWKEGKERTLNQYQGSLDALKDELNKLKLDLKAGRTSNHGYVNPYSYSRNEAVSKAIFETVPFICIKRQLYLHKFPVCILYFLQHPIL